MIQDTILSYANRLILIKNNHLINNFVIQLNLKFVFEIFVKFIYQNQMFSFHSKKVHFH